MNIVIAPDSFKGSLTAIQVSDVIENAIKDYNEQFKVIKKPMADGGEGTIDAILSATTGEVISINCTGPLGELIPTSYATIDGGQTAVIECAKMAGLIQVPEEKRNPDHTTTYGIGETILAALDKGCTSIIIGLGGSATNDGGLGMLLALGMEAFDEQGNKVGIYGQDVHKIRSVDFSKIDSRLNDVAIKVASDVDNPLCGTRGASSIYGPQKGATAEQVKSYDQSLYNFSRLVESNLQTSIRDVAGAGAAGGLGFGLLAIGGQLVSGAELLANAIDMETAIQKADIVLTGEGQSDAQTLYGKAPGYIASVAAKYDVPTILISGGIEEVEQLSHVFAGSFSIINKPLTLQACIEQADTLLYQQTKQVIQLVSTLKK